jgi:hypothetical protein
MTMQYKELVTAGSSTPGPKQQNDVVVTVYPTRLYALLGVPELVEVLVTYQQLGSVLLALNFSGQCLRQVDLFESVFVQMKKIQFLD